MTPYKQIQEILKELYKKELIKLSKMKWWQGVSWNWTNHDLQIQKQRWLLKGITRSINTLKKHLTPNQ